MAKKKSYNPFKMWGSYVGLLIGVIIAFVDGEDSDIFSWMIDDLFLPLINDYIISILY